VTHDLCESLSWENRPVVLFVAFVPNATRSVTAWQEAGRVTLSPDAKALRVLRPVMKRPGCCERDTICAGKVSASS